MSKKDRNIQTQTVEASSIQYLAHQIHIGYGGSDLDNWLEAERTLQGEQIKVYSKGG